MHCARLASAAALAALILAAPACGGDDDGGSSPDAGGGDEADAAPPAGPECGDGATEGAEECDDGNDAGGDGCSADCSAASCLVPVTHESIQDAIDDVDCPAVWVLPGTYEENLVIDRDVGVEGTGVGEVIVDGGADGRVVDITSNGVSRLTGFTVQNGAAATGAGVATTGFTTLSRMRIIDNVASGSQAFGGGILALGQTLLDDTEVSGNTATNGDETAIAPVLGGGVLVQWVLFVTNGSSISGNTASVDDGGQAVAGGGIAITGDATVLITGGSSVSDNVAENTQTGASAIAVGGGVAAFEADGSVFVRGGSVIEGNRARATSTTGGATASGGGIGCSDADGVVLTEGVRVVDNRARAEGAAGAATAFGGGISAHSCPFLGNESRITGNRVVSEGAAATRIGGGGGHVVETAGAGLTAMTVADNEVEVAGGTAAGGGVAFQYGDGHTATLGRSTLSGNAVTGGNTFGGGIYLSAGDAANLTPGNSTVSGNTAAGTASTSGGGIFASVEGTGDDSLVRLFNVTVTDNAATGGTGGGLHLDAGTGATISTIFASSIVYGNTGMTSPETECAGAGTAVLTSTQGNVWGDTTGCTGAGNFATDSTDDPDLGALAEDGGLTMTHDIGAGGSAVDAGDPDGCSNPTGGVCAVDPRGEPRPAGPECDSGAVERQ